MRLRYKAVTKENKIVRGLLEAKDTDEAVRYLRGKELIPITVSSESRNEMAKYFPFLNKVKQSDLILFTRQLSSMLNSGLTLIKSLEILREQINSQTMNEIIGGIIADIEEGKTLSSAISRYPDIFSPIYVSIIKSAESSGLLDRALSHLADNLEKQAKLRNTIRSALTYPTIVVILMFVVVFIMMTVVIPQLSGLYENLNVELPLPTKIIMKLSDFMTVSWPLIIVIVGLAVFLFRRWHKTDAGKLVIDNLILKAPIFGNLSKKVILTEFSRTFSLLVGSGTLVVDSLMQTADTLGNIHYKNAIIVIAKKVENGVSVGDALSSYSLFPPLLTQLVKIGEETGKLDETLLKASEYFESEADQSVKMLTTSLEPIIMVTLGAGVAFLLVSVITPIYSLISSIK